VADPQRRRRDERGTALLLIIGFAVVLLMVAAVVTDASAAYLRRQGLDTLADGAALTAADAGASGAEAYADGLDRDLHLDPGRARAAALDYLRRVHAYVRFPALTARVTVDVASRRVTVIIRAPLRLPLHVPGSPQRTVVVATGAASVAVDS
jgi:hypothetical protein